MRERERDFGGKIIYSMSHDKYNSNITCMIFLQLVWTSNFISIISISLSITLNHSLSPLTQPHSITPYITQSYSFSTQSLTQPHSIPQLYHSTQPLIRPHSIPPLSLKIFFLHSITHSTTLYPSTLSLHISLNHLVYPLYH